MQEDPSKMPGRNDPCPCGSGKKYKQCCRDNDRAAQSAADRARAAQESQVAMELDKASNAIQDLIQAGRLDEAEPAALQLQEDYPGAPDGHWRLAMLYEARGDRARAIESYRAVLQLLQAQPAGSFEPAYQQLLHRKIAELSSG